MLSIVALAWSLQESRFEVTTTFSAQEMFIFTLTKLGTAQTKLSIYARLLPCLRLHASDHTHRPVVRQTAAADSRDDVHRPAGLHLLLLLQHQASVEAEYPDVLQVGRVLALCRAVECCQ